MTAIPDYKFHINPKTFGDAIKSFNGTEESHTAGMEMERFILKLTPGGYELPDARLHNIFFKALHERIGDDTSVEPGAHMIEIKTGVHNNALSLCREINSHLEVCKSTAKNYGLIVVPSSDLKGYPPEKLARNLIAPIDPITGQKRRAPELAASYLKRGLDHMVHYSCSTTSIQFTHNVPDADTLHRWAKIHSAMMPLYYSAFENRTRSANGIHTSLAARRSLGRQGLIPDYAFKARNGDDFINKYINFSLQTKMFTKLGSDGADIMLDPPVTFLHLPESDQTLGNLLQAASMSWNVVKIRSVVDSDALKAGNLKLQHLLIEARDMDSSDKAVPAIAGWFFGLTASEDTLNQAEHTLESLGMPVTTNPEAAEVRTSDALMQVQNNPRTYLDTRYGEKSTLRDIVNQLVLPVLKNSNDGTESLDLWNLIARSHQPVFKADLPSRKLACDREKNSSPPPRMR